MHLKLRRSWYYIRRAEVKDGDILVGKVTPKGVTELTAEERLLRHLW